MKFWQVVAMTDMDELPALAKKAEELGFEGVTLGDHLITFGTQYDSYLYSEDSQAIWYPQTHWPDPWVQFAALSQITTHLKFMTSIYVAPMRDPFTVAKSLSTVARISNNRVVLGVGVGWQQAEFDLVGQSFRTRGRRTDEMLEVIKLLMSGEMVEHHGEFYDFEPLQMSPGVSEPVPVYVGGYTPAALKRAARNDGWVGAQNNIDEVPGIIAGLRAQRQAIGLELDDDFDIILALNRLTKSTVERAQELGATKIYAPAWLDKNGRASQLTLEQKISEMEAFADKFL